MGFRRRFPMLRSSVLSAGSGIQNIDTTGQLGDGREAAYAHTQSFLVCSP